MSCWVAVAMRTGTGMLAMAAIDGRAPPGPRAPACLGEGRNANQATPATTSNNTTSPTTRRRLQREGWETGRLSDMERFRH
ncbi:hypothetical protein D3C87_1706340 [compost metagenome]